MQVSEYVISRGIQNEPAFAWWVPYVMQKRDVIVSAVKSRVRKTTHKYGIEMPVPSKKNFRMQLIWTVKWEYTVERFVGQGDGKLDDCI